MGQIIASRVFAAVGAVLTAGILWVCTARQDAAAWVVGTPDGAAECVEAFAQELNRGDLEAASAFLLDMPNLTIPGEARDETGMQLWNAYVDSLECTPAGECFPVSTGIAEKIQLYRMDLPGAAGALQERTQSLLAERVEAAEDMTEVYTEDHNYRPDFLSRLLQDAAAEAIAAAPRLEQELTLRLLLRDGRWVVVPDAALLEVLSGGI